MNDKNDDGWGDSQNYPLDTLGVSLLRNIINQTEAPLKNSTVFCVRFACRSAFLRRAQVELEDLFMAFLILGFDLFEKTTPLDVFQRQLGEEYIEQLKKRHTEQYPELGNWNTRTFSSDKANSKELGISWSNSSQNVLKQAGTLCRASTGGKGQVASYHIFAAILKNSAEADSPGGAGLTIAQLTTRFLDSISKSTEAHNALIYQSFFTLTPEEFSRSTGVPNTADKKKTSRQSKSSERTERVNRERQYSPNAHYPELDVFDQWIAKHLHHLHVDLSNDAFHLLRGAIKVRPNRKSDPPELTFFSLIASAINLGEHYPVTDPTGFLSTFSKSPSTKFRAGLENALQQIQVNPDKKDSEAFFAISRQILHVLDHASATLIKTSHSITAADLMVALGELPEPQEPSREWINWQKLKAAINPDQNLHRWLWNSRFHLRDDLKRRVLTLREHVEPTSFTQGKEQDNKKIEEPQLEEKIEKITPKKKEKPQVKDSTSWKTDFDTFFDDKEFGDGWSKNVALVLESLWREQQRVFRETLDQESLDEEFHPQLTPRALFLTCLLVGKSTQINGKRGLLQAIAGVAQFDSQKLKDKTFLEFRSPRTKIDIDEGKIIGEEFLSVFKQADKIRRTTGKDSNIGSRHLIAALLLPPPSGPAESILLLRERTNRPQFIEVLKSHVKSSPWAKKYETEETWELWLNQLSEPFTESGDSDETGEGIKNGKKGPAGTLAEYNRDPKSGELGGDEKKYARAIASSFLSTGSGDFCFGLFGPWGRGKSTLIREVSKELEGKFESVTFNAWKYPSRPEVWVSLYENIKEQASGGNWFKKAKLGLQCRLRLDDGFPLFIPSLLLLLSTFSIWSTIALLIPIPENPNLENATAVFSKEFWSEVRDFLITSSDTIMALIALILVALYGKRLWSGFGTTLKSFVELPDHGKHLGLQAAVGDDLGRLVATWSRAKPTDPPKNSVWMKLSDTFAEWSKIWTAKSEACIKKDKTCFKGWNRGRGKCWWVGSKWSALWLRVYYLGAKLWKKLKEKSDSKISEYQNQLPNNSFKSVSLLAWAHKGFTLGFLLMLTSIGVLAYRISGSASPQLLCLLAILAGITVILFVVLLWPINPARQILLIVDDLDRCPPAEMLAVIESLRVFLDDPKISSHMKVAMLLDRDILAHAICQKHKRLLPKSSNENNEPEQDDRIGRRFTKESLITEQIEKYFLLSFDLPALQEDTAWDIAGSIVGLPRTETSKLKQRNKEKEKDKARAQPHDGAHTEVGPTTNQLSNPKPILDSKKSAPSVPPAPVDQPHSDDEPTPTIQEEKVVEEVRKVDLNDEEKEQMLELLTTYSTEKDDHISPRRMRIIKMRYFLARQILRELGDEPDHTELMKHFRVSSPPQLDAQLAEVVEMVAGALPKNERA